MNAAVQDAPTGAALIEDAAEDASIQTHEVDAAEQLEIAAAAEKATRLENIPVSLIVKSDVSLRDTQRNKEEYQFLCNSIRKHGVLNSILVRELSDGRFGLIDGLQRWSACQDVGRTTIPANIVDMSDAEILEAQLITNVVRVVTRPADQSKHLLRIMGRNPFMTKDELAERVSQSVTWVEQRLALNKLLPELQELINQKKINLSNGFALSMIPQEEQMEHLDAALSEKPATFIARMKQRRKEIKDAEKAGKDAGPAEFHPQPHLRKSGFLKEQFDLLADKEATPAFAPVIEADAGVKYEGDIKKAVDAFFAWLLCYDLQSQEEQIEQDKMRKEKATQRREELKAERKAQQEKKAAQDAADITQGW